MFAAIHGSGLRAKRGVPWIDREVLDLLVYFCFQFLRQGNILALETVRKPDLHGTARRSAWIASLAVLNGPFIRPCFTSSSASSISRSTARVGLNVSLPLWMLACRRSPTVSPASLRKQLGIVTWYPLFTRISVAFPMGILYTPLA